MADEAVTALTKPEEEFIGHAVDPTTKDVRFLSVSAIRLYDRLEEAGCPRRWWFRYVQGIKEPPSTRAALGVLIAREIEIYLTTGAFRPAGEMKTPEAVRAVVIAKSGAHFLPAPGPDLEVEQRLGDLVGAVRARDAGASLEEVVRLAGLTAGGIPLAGAADFRHRRGEYVDATGVLRREDRPDVTTEVGDHKSTRRINDQKSKSGRVSRGYGKTVEQILADTQMLGYGVHEVNRNPKVEMLRLGQIYYPTEGNEVPEKRTDLIAAEEVVRRWRRLDALAREIQDVARETDVSKIPVNLGACNAYFRACPYMDKCPKTADQIFMAMRFQGATVPRPKPQPLALPDWITGGQAPPQPPVSSFITEEKTKMSLFNKLKKADAPAPAPAPAVAPAAGEDRARIEAEKARLRAEDAANATSAGGAGGDKPPEVVKPESAPSGKIPVTACEPGKPYVLPDGRRMNFTKALGGNYEFSNGTTGVILDAIAYVTEVPVIGLGQVLPTDAPVYDLTDSAAPLKPEVIAAIQDPEIRARAEAHAKVHRERAEALEAAAALAAAEAAKQEAAEMASKASGKAQEPAKVVQGGEGASGPATTAPARSGGRCPGGNIRRVLTVEEVAEREVVCEHCGKRVGVRPGKIDANKYEATIPGHNAPKDAGGDATSGGKPPAPPEKTVQQESQVKQEPQAKQEAQPESKPEPKQEPQANVQPKQTGGDGEAQSAQLTTTIFVDIGVVRGDGIQPLSTYYDEIVKGILEMSKDTLDIRCSPDERLAFSKWKGVLAAYCKSRPITPGEYTATSMSEIDMIVVDALRGVRVLRGVR